MTCTFTIEDLTESAEYNGSPLDITTESLSEWNKAKTVTFESCYDSSPGTLTIKGSDNESGKIFPKILATFQCAL